MHTYREACTLQQTKDQTKPLHCNKGSRMPQQRSDTARIFFLKWDFPKGKGLSSLRVARQEVTEEVGLDQFSSVAQSCLTLCNLMDCSQASLSITNSHSLLKLMSIESVMPSNHLNLCHPLLPPSVFPSIRVLSNESVLCIRWPKYWSFSFSISPSNEYSGLISFRMDRLDLLAVQGTLKRLLQHHSSKASIPQHSAFLKSPALTSIHDYWKNHSFD